MELNPQHPLRTAGFPNFLAVTIPRLLHSCCYKLEGMMVTSSFDDGFYLLQKHPAYLTLINKLHEFSFALPPVDLRELPAQIAS